MKNQIQFSWKNKETVSVSSAEKFTQSTKR